MNTDDLQSSGARLYGNGLLARAYLNTLSKGTPPPKSTIRDRWYGLQASLPLEANRTLTAVQTDRGGF